MVDPARLRRWLPGESGQGHARRWLGFLLLVTLAGRLWVALADYRALLGADYWQDDAFYYFTIARNLIGGHGLTFDGVNPTNGFQPLFFFLLLPIVALAGPDKVWPLHAAGVLLACVGAATGYLVYALGRRLAGEAAGLLGLALFAVSPYFTIFGVNLQETGLVLAFVVALPLLYLKWFRRPGGPSWRQSTLMGLASGLGVLARIDIVLLLLALGIDWLAGALRLGITRRRAAAAALTILIAIMAWAPWGVASRAFTGYWLPQSGQASRQIALNSGWVLLERSWSDPRGDELFNLDRVPASWYGDVATKLAALTALESPLLGPLRLSVPFVVWPDLGRYLPFRLMRGGLPLKMAVLGILALLAAAAALAAARRFPSSTDGGGPPSINLIFGLYMSFFFLFHVLAVPAHWNFSRYLTGPVLLGMLWGLSLAGSVMGKWEEDRRRVKAVGGAVAAVLIGSQLFLAVGPLRLLSAPHPAAGFLDSWELLGSKVGTDGGFGAFQAGILGWFSGRRVVNLDGKVNAEACRAVAEGKLQDYVDRNGIRYLMDWEWVLWSLCLRYSPAAVDRYEPVATDESGSGLSLWRLSPPDR